jgi:hypothetical protein
VGGSAGATDGPANVLIKFGSKATPLNVSLPSTVTQVR